MESTKTMETVGSAANAPSLAYLCSKRVGDFAVALILSLLTLPLAVLIALCVFLRDPGNPFYLQKRLGKNGSAITVLKFRTMKQRADHLEEMLSPEELALYRTEYKLSDDPRLIGYRKKGDGRRCFGAILRRTSMDEIPQLWWNVLLCGNMSMVGPRPILPEEMERHYTPEEQRLLLSVKPGVTGYWQAYARNTVGYIDGERQRMELYYAQNRGGFLDLRILLRTVVAVFTKVGAK